jgi:phospholipid-binding lipoprotein MlaA
MGQSRNRLRLLIATAAVAQFAAGPVWAQRDPSDPWEHTNRGFYRLENVLDHTLLAPLALVYRVLPKFVRTALRHAANNIGEPVVAVNDVLQGHPGKAVRTTSRFVVNSTVGVAGVLDVGKRVGLPHHDNDFGLTLGRWGAKPGPYLFLPLFGPSTVRDAIGTGVNFALDPFTWVKFAHRGAITLGATVVSGIDRRAEATQDLATINATSTDPYASIRSYYLQDRAAQVRGPGSDIGDLPNFDAPDAGGAGGAQTPPTPTAPLPTPSPAPDATTSTPAPAPAEPPAQAPAAPPP